jgi:hypothetical protein
MVRCFIVGDLIARPSQIAVSTSIRQGNYGDAPVSPVDVACDCGIDAHLRTGQLDGCNDRLLGERLSSTLDLWDYRRQVHDIYMRVREAEPGEEAWHEWRRERDRLFSDHPQSPIEDHETFHGLEYFQYDPGWRALAEFSPVRDEPTLIDASGEGTARFVKTGTLHFELKGNLVSLDVLWLDAYGGGVFLPFRDATNGDTTYGGGRYLLDAVKGADLGHHGSQVVLDFNYAYHPSCVHSSRWACPLAPPANHLGFAVEAGERLSPGDQVLEPT